LLSPIFYEKTMNEIPLIYIVIGVSGSGKSTIGRRFAQYLECDFLEGDRRHSQANVKKMSSGKPLEDGDRRQWLADIEADIRWSLDRKREVVITCSAIKTGYRNQLNSLGRVQLVWLDVPTLVLEQRLKARPNHYMKFEMLASQIAAFESIALEEEIITIDGSGSIDDVMSELISKAIQRFPTLHKSWWER
jgi:gluconokinase